jgi:hypothetical protein
MAMQIREELLADIDATLDQLIQNAEVAYGVCSDPFYEVEMDAMHKTQESLLAHLMRVSTLLGKEQVIKAPLIEEKMTHFKEINSLFLDQMNDPLSMHKRKKKQTQRRVKTAPTS